MRRPAWLQKRVFGRGAVARKPKGRVLPFPAPVEGWDAVSSLMEMKPRRAIQMDNWIPRTDSVEPRRGSVHSGDTGVPQPIESLMPYHGLEPGLDKLWCAVGEYIFDATPPGMDVHVFSGLDNARWQHVNFTTIDGLNILWICNGASTERYWNGTSWTLVGLSGDAAPGDIIHVAVFKKRLWLTKVDSLNPVYLDVGAITGAATEFPLDGVFQLGGFLMAIGTWSLDGGAGPDDHIAFISSRGEVAIYSGTNPASDFNLVGVYNMGPPIGRRCLRKVGADLAVLCIDGVVPLSKALITERGAAISIALTANIQPVVNKSAALYKGQFGWQLTSYPASQLAILNVPIREGLEQRQYVMNTITGAWCQFIGWNANCFEVFQDRLFFGGNDGVVYEADRSGSDNGATIVCELRTAYNYCGNRGTWKGFPLVQPIMISDRQIDPAIGLDCDFKTGELDGGSPVAAPLDLAQWDVAIWDQSLWPAESTQDAEWRVAGGEGYCVSIHMKVALGTIEAEAA